MQNENKNPNVTTDEEVVASNVTIKTKSSKTPFSVLESYKSIRIHLVSILAKTNGKIVAISSPNASEGKSTTAVNIAITLSQLNKKVVIIDADTRRATVHKKLKLENSLGCLDIIANDTPIDDAIHHYSSYLDVITSGTFSSNPSELFSSSAFDKMLSELSSKYDYVIIDTPPINLISDALVISQKCDGLLLVLRAGVTSIDSFKQTIASTNELNIFVLGVVINGSDAAPEGLYKYRKYGKYGRYGYGKYKKYGYYK